jgi:SAM-dependent methyltransferase
MSRWLSETGGTSGRSYAARFAALAASGADLHGEARYVDSLLAPASTVLDAGCGTGRVAVELARRGHDVVGADSDPSMLAVAQDSPGVRWVLADLAALDLPDRFDLVVAAGNVMVFLEPGSEPRVVAGLAAHLRPGGLLVSGWRTDRLDLATYDRWALQAGLEPVVRHATWDAEPWRDDADWCVAVDRAADLGAAGA